MQTPEKLEPLLSWSDMPKIRARILRVAPVNGTARLSPGEFARAINAEISPVADTLIALTKEGSLIHDPINLSGWHVPCFRRPQLFDQMLKHAKEQEKNGTA